MQIQRINAEQSHLVIDLFDQYRVFYKKESDKGLAKAFIEARLNSNESVIFVALDKTGEPAGFVQLYPKFSSGRAIKIWVLNDLYVAPAYRKLGLGRQLIQTTIDYATADHVSIVELCTATDNFNAQALYESIGFVKHNPDEGFFNYKISV